MALIEQRNNAKNMRDFDAADQHRNALESMGVRLDDRSRTWTTPWGVSGKMDGAGGAARGDRVLEDGSISWENTIYVQGLPSSASKREIADFFGSIGAIKKSKKSYNQGEPTIHLYKDKATGQLKGDGTISYDEVATAQAAIEWFSGKPFGDPGRYPNSVLQVSIARRPAADRFGKGKGGRRF
eukprot:scaffold295479_cov33-Tisochrysis_lutea.AAC.2